MATYTDAEKQEAVIMLAVNKYDYKKTAEQTGVSIKTLRRWDKLAPKKGVPELLERAIERMLVNIPDTWKGGDWAVALGILMDKWLLVQGKATSRNENVFSWLQSLPSEELDDLVKQFEQAANSPGSSED